MTTKLNYVDPDAKRAVIALLMRGLIVPAEVPRLAGVSRQLAHHWVKQSGVRHVAARDATIAKLFRKELRHGSKLVETTAPRSSQPHATNGHR